MALTIADKEDKIRGACLEIAIIVNDWRAKVARGFETAIMLWEKCCTPSLMHGAGRWVEIDQNTEKTQNRLQNLFVRLIWQTSKGSPLEALLWDSQLLDMKIRVWSEKNLIGISIKQSLQETNGGKSAWTG